MTPREKRSAIRGCIGFGKTHHLPHKHPLLPHLGITHQHHHPRRAIPRPPPHPPDTIRGIEIIILLAIRVQLSGEGQIWDLALRRRGFPVVFNPALDAVEVAVEETGIAVRAEEDQRVRVGEEPVGDLQLEGLAGLGVVVLDLGGGVSEVVEADGRGGDMFSVQVR